jgi:hypothetical protein
MPQFIGWSILSTQTLAAGKADVTVTCPVPYDPQTSIVYTVEASNNAGAVSVPLLVPGATTGLSVGALNFAEIGESGVTVQGQVRNGNASTAIHLEYGLTTAYGMTSGTAPMSICKAPVRQEPPKQSGFIIFNAPVVVANPVSPILSGAQVVESSVVPVPIPIWGTPVPVSSVNLSGLSPHTTYHVRCVARSGTQVAYSPDGILETLPRMDASGDGFTELLLSDDLTGETTLLSIGTAVAPVSGTLAVTGLATALSLPANREFLGQAEFNQIGTLGWALADTVEGKVEIWTLAPPPTPFYFGTEIPGTWSRYALDKGWFRIPPGVRAVEMVDIDGDGNPDLVLKRPSGQLVFALLEGFNMSGRLGGPMLSPGFEVAAIDDLTGDAKPDLLLWNPQSRQTQILAMNGPTVVATIPGPQIPAGWQLMGSGVFVGQSPDWLLYNPTTRATRIWVMQQGSKLSELDGPVIPAGMTLLGTK